MFDISDGTDDEYGKLPQSIKDRFSRENYLWLPNDVKRDLLRSETEPEVE